jgi:hypothetical protein
MIDLNAAPCSRTQNTTTPSRTCSSASQTHTAPTNGWMGA